MKSEERWTGLPQRHFEYINRRAREMPGKKTRHNKNSEILLAETPKFGKFPFLGNEFQDQQTVF